MFKSLSYVISTLVGGGLEGWRVNSNNDQNVSWCVHIKSSFIDVLVVDYVRPRINC